MLPQHPADDYALRDLRRFARAAVRAASISASMFSGPFALVAPDDAPVDLADKPRAHRAFDVERRMVRGDAQRRVDVAERIRVI